MPVGPPNKKRNLIKLLSSYSMPYPKRKTEGVGQMLISQKPNSPMQIKTSLHQSTYNLLK